MLPTAAAAAGVGPLVALARTISTAPAVCNAAAAVQPVLLDRLFWPGRARVDTPMNESLPALQSPQKAPPPTAPPQLQTAQ